MFGPRKASTDQDRSVGTYDGQKPSSTSQQSEPKGKEAVTQDGSVKTYDGQKPSSTSQQSETKGKKAVTMYRLLPQTKLLEEWKSPEGIYSICPTTDGQVWTSYFNTNILALLDRKGTVIKEIEHKNKIYKASLSPTTQTLWISDTENNIMELVSGQLTQRFNTKEGPWCICVTAGNNVIVGMTHNVSKFTTQGQLVITTSVTVNRKPLVCSPYRISECPVTLNVAVIDWNNEEDGGDGNCHVIVMDTDFNKLFVYRGDIPSSSKQASHGEDEPFSPFSVVYDSVGNIIIGEYHNYRVLLISGDGEFLRIIHTDTAKTYAVSVDKEDVLWADYFGKMKLLQYSSV